MARSVSKPSSRGRGIETPVDVTAALLRRRVGLGLAILASLWLGYQVFAVAQAQRYAKDRPEQALAWRPGHAAALGRAAEEALLAAQPSGQSDEAVAMAREALAVSPLNLRALKVLGMSAASTGQDAQAEALISLAAQRSLRDPSAHLWLFQRRVNQRDWPRAFFHADVLLAKPPRGYQIATIVVALAAQPGAEEALSQRMIRRPRWRGGVIAGLARSSPSLTFDMLMRLAAAGSPPTDAETGWLMRAMLSRGALPEAYLAWAQLLPPSAVHDMADVYDSGFDGLRGGPPFNWRLASQDAAGATLGPGPGGEGKALYARFHGKKPAVLAYQLLLLPPGRYRLVTRAYTEESGRGSQLRWTLACAQRRSASMAQAAAPDEAFVWRQASVPFEVPEGCPGQRLELTGHPGDNPGAARAWFDSVAVERF